MQLTKRHQKVNIFILIVIIMQKSSGVVLLSNKYFLKVIKLKHGVTMLNFVFNIKL